MPLTPICPKCGSVKTVKVRRPGKPSIDRACEEPDCRYVGMRKHFMKGGPSPTGQTYRKEPNQKWRDPVAGSMDGYEGSP